MCFIYSKFGISSGHSCVNLSFMVYSIKCIKFDLNLKLLHMKSQQTISYGFDYVFESNFQRIELTQLGK